ncbi:MAG: hypothetical protein UT02_C0012G0021 [Parcubacteria group bacterium GW2011_GWC2_38_7]|nr:MAG: hypothetical protein UT02_C0012G0021 [Parcubacteria group bacterium GW2011_GWC2_38_7]
MNKKGFTLIELVLYIGITAIILTASLSLAWSVIFNQTKTTALIETNYNYQFLDNFLREQIQSAQSINLTQSVLGTNPSRLVLNNPDSSITIFETEDKTITQNGQDFVLTNIKVTLPNTAPLSLITNKIDFKNFVINYSEINRQIISDISLEYLNSSQDIHYGASKDWTNSTSLRAE